MESLSSNVLFEFPPDTLQAVRKNYDLDKPGRMDEAIDILDAWVKMQNHFLKKDFDRDYLERTIITTKGSVERAKKQLDRRCTLKTLMPEFFQICNVKEDFQEMFKVINILFLPKPTPDFYRLSIVKTYGKGLGSALFKYYRYAVMLAEYMKTYDYCNGVVFIFDFRDVNILELITSINLTELRQMLEILLQGYGYRIKAFHFLSESKAIDAFMTIMRQVYSAKLVKRVRIHSTLEELYEYVPKEYLPVDYGGEGKSMVELIGNNVNALSSKEFIDYLQVMYKAGTNESLRPKDAFNDEYLGTPGTFRTLSVD